MAEKIQITEKAAKVLLFLQGQEEPLPGRAIAEATDLNPKGIHGVLNALVKNELVAKGDKVTMSIVDNKGLTQEREYVTYYATQAGLDFEIE